jgi:D-alanyl-D-alanine carboxypeptidase
MHRLNYPPPHDPDPVDVPKKLDPTMCQLVIPKGKFIVSPGAAVLLQPAFAEQLGFAIEELHKLGITPIITSGFRTTEQQHNISDKNKYGKARGTSAHEVGLAVDIVSAKKSDAAIIRKIMTKHGIKNGQYFSPPDPIHYFYQNARDSQKPEIAKTCRQTYDSLLPPVQE